MRCADCARVFPVGSTTCPGCGAARPAVEPAFAQAETSYLALREDYESGAISAEDFKTQIEAQRLEHGGRYWMLGVNSGQWYVYDGTSWREQDAPLAAGQTTQVTRDRGTDAPVPGVSAPSAASREPARPASGGRRRFGQRAMLVAGLAAVALAATYAGWRRMPSNDPIVSGLMKAQLPASVFSAQDFDQPELSKRDKDWEAGQIAQLWFLKRKFEHGFYSFAVFRRPQEARGSYEAFAKSDEAGAKSVGLETFDVPDVGANCIGRGDTVGSCRALAGRTVIGIIFRDDPKSKDQAIRIVQTLVQYVDSLGT